MGAQCGREGCARWRRPGFPPAPAASGTASAGRAGGLLLLLLLAAAAGLPAAVGNPGRAPSPAPPRPRAASRALAPGRGVGRRRQPEGAGVEAGQRQRPTPRGCRPRPSARAPRLGPATWTRVSVYTPTSSFRTLAFTSQAGRGPGTAGARHMAGPMGAEQPDGHWPGPPGHTRRRLAAGWPPEGWAVGSTALTSRPPLLPRAPPPRAEVFTFEKRWRLQVPE